MGCDIHTYIEWADAPREDGSFYWKSFTDNGGSRDYVMFGVLAGVRVPDAQLFEPKGMPEGDLGWSVNEAYWNLVAPEDHPEWADADDGNWVSLDRADRWVASGSSIGERDNAGRLRRVTDPDWHTHSWLTTDELARALDHYVAIIASFWPGESGVPAEWAAMLAAMRSFETSGKQTRIIFWFDN